MNRKASETVSSSVAEADNYTRWILSRFHKYMGQAVMEVGLGYGNYRHFLGTAQHYCGVDIDPDIVTKASRRYPNSEYLVADISTHEFVEKVGKRHFDAILCVNVLEHIENDCQAVANLRGMLNRGGHLLLFVPAFPALYTDLDRLAGHVRRYTRRYLGDLLLKNEMKILELEYFNPIGALGWWGQKFVRHASLESGFVTSQVKLFDRYILPISRALNPITRKWFGQSIICAARRDQ